MTTAASPAASMGVRLLGVVGRGGLPFVGDLGRMGLFLGSALARVPRRPFRPLELISRFEFVGARSTGIAVLSSVFTGLVLTLHMTVDQLIERLRRQLPAVR